MEKQHRNGEIWGCSECQFFPWVPSPYPSGSVALPQGTPPSPVRDARMYSCDKFSSLFSICVHRFKFRKALLGLAVWRGQGVWIDPVQLTVLFIHFIMCSCLSHLAGKSVRVSGQIYYLKGWGEKNSKNSNKLHHHSIHFTHSTINSV